MANPSFSQTQKNSWAVFYGLGQSKHGDRRGSGPKQQQAAGAQRQAGGYDVVQEQHIAALDQMPVTHTD